MKVYISDALFYQTEPMELRQQLRGLFRDMSEAPEREWDYRQRRADYLQGTSTLIQPEE